MSGVKKSRGGKGFRYLSLAKSLQKDIETGRYAIGGKIPSERDLAKKIKASHLTVRQGVDVLVKMGLVRREPGSGTYVNAIKADPIIGILFGPSLVEESAHFYRALLGALEAEIAGSPYTCRSYDGLNRTDVGEVENSLPYQQLLRDSRNHPVKGFIQISLNDARWNELSPLKGIPRSTHGEASRDILIDYSFFGRDALEYVVQNQRRKVVYLRSFLNSQNDLAGCGDTAKRLGVPMPKVVQIESEQNLDLVAHDLVCAMAMEWSRDGSHPDALIVSDDIATRGVAIALIKAGLKVPSDVLLVTLASEGINHHYGVDAVRYVTSPSKIARELMRVLEKKIMGLDADVPCWIAGDWAPDSPENSGKPSAKSVRQTASFP